MEKKGDQIGNYEISDIRYQIVASYFTLLVGFLNLWKFRLIDNAGSLH